jgi:hypothetical protein
LHSILTQFDQSNEWLHYGAAVGLAHIAIGLIVASSSPSRADACIRALVRSATATGLEASNKNESRGAQGKEQAARSWSVVGAVYGLTLLRSHLSVQWQNEIAALALTSGQLLQSRVQYIRDAQTVNQR